MLYSTQSRGHFYKPTCISNEQFDTELDFFGLKRLHESFLEAQLKEEINPNKNATHENPVTAREKIWNFFKDPESSQAARIWAIIDVSSKTK